MSEQIQPMMLLKKFNDSLDHESAREALRAVNQGKTPRIYDAQLSDDNR